MNQPTLSCLPTFLLSTRLPLPTAQNAHDMPTWQALAEHHYTAWPTAFERAVAGGFCSQSTGIAFAAGYQSALQALVPDTVDFRAASFCVTEASGNRPAAIATTLKPTAEGWILDGQKSFVSGADQAQCLLVAASTGTDEQGRNRLVMVAVDTHQPGISISALPPLPFAPEFSHGSVQLTQVSITAGQILPGDGYADYIKPFRTVEDIFVGAALLGHCLRQARLFQLSSSLQEELLALVMLHKQLAEQPASAPATHIALAGSRHLAESTLSRFETALHEADPAQGRLWSRDKLLLNVAAKARQQRTLRAWESAHSASA